MSPATTRRLALGLFGASVVLLVVGVPILLLGVSTATGPTFGFRGFQFLTGLAFSLVGTVVALRRPENAIGWILAGMGFLFSLQGALQAYAVYALVVRGGGELPGGVIANWVVSWVWAPAVTAAAIVFLLFPTGRPRSDRWRWVLGAAPFIVVLFAAAFAVYPGPLTEVSPREIPNPFGLYEAQWLANAIYWLITPLGALLLGAGALSLVLRWRTATGDERQQLKWIAVAASLVAVAIVLVAAFEGAEPVELFLIITLTAIPVFTGIAILKYRLYDIDVVINKTVVLATLAAFITAVYVAVVVGVGSLIGAGDGSNVALSILATVVLAMAFQPVRTRVQRFANRLVYGDRATPYEVMSGFAHRVAGTLSVEDVIPRMAQAAAEGVAAAGSRVRLFLPDASERSVWWPDEGSESRFDRVLPVSHRGSAVGEIAVVKPRGEQLTPAEEGLLEDLASQAGLALHNVQLALELRSRLEQISRVTEELHASRQRIVTAQDAERRRLERDIRAGAEVRLEALVEKLDRAEALLLSDPAAAGLLLDELGSDAGGALDALRDLARGIYPPLLGDQGPVAALVAHVRKARLPARVLADASVDGRRFDPRIEAAVYFCCLEALDNAGRHAPGAPVTVSVSADDEGLSFAIADEGPGFEPVAVTDPSGLQRMRDRAEALGGTLDVRSSPGGGTVVVGRLPADRGPAGDQLAAPEAALQASSSRSGPNTDLGM